jgi:hypothetical protein
MVKKKTEKATLTVALVLSSLLFVFAVPLGLADVHHCPFTTPSGSSGVLVMSEERTTITLNSTTNSSFLSTKR